MDVEVREVAPGVWQARGSAEHFRTVGGKRVLAHESEVGHTSGHCAFHLPERGAPFSGDALMTDHAARGGLGRPQVGEVIPCSPRHART